MRLASTYALLERPAVLVPMALLLLAAAGGMMWTNVTVRRPAPPAAQPAPLPVAINGLTAAADIARGQVLTARDLLARGMAPSRLPPGLLRQNADAEGHMALVSIKAGQPILARDLSATAVQGISARVPEGYRAYALAVTEAEIAGGFLQAGDHVDLYVTLPGALFGDAKDGDRSKSSLLQSSVKVLAVGTKLDNDGVANTAVRTVTLALSAEALAKVALAARLGAITLAIRNPADDQAQDAEPAGLDTLVRDTAPAPVAAATASPKRAVTHGIPMLLGKARITIPVP
jgi:pilus assembly protein CpaB